MKQFNATHKVSHLIACVALCVLVFVYLFQSGVNSEEYYMDSYVGGQTLDKFNNLPALLYPITIYSSSINVRGYGKDREIIYADSSYGGVVRLNETTNMVTKYFGMPTASIRFTHWSSLSELKLVPKYLTTFNNDIYFVSTSPSMIGKINSYNIVELIMGSTAVACVDGGVARDCELTSMAGFEVTSDRVYILNNCLIWYIDRLSGKIFKYAGTDQCGFADGPLLSAKFNGPNGIISVNGSLYVSQSSCIRLVTSTDVSTYTGSCTSVADISGPIGASRFVGISGIAYNPIENVFVVLDGNKVKKIDSTKISVYAGSIQGSCADGEDAGTAKFTNPYGLKVDQFTGDSYFFSNFRLLKVSNNKVSYIIGSGSPGYNETGFDKKYADLYYSNLDTKFDGNYLYYSYSYGVKKVNYKTGIISIVAGCTSLSNCVSTSTNSDYLSLTIPISSVTANKYRQEIYLSHAEPGCIVKKVVNHTIDTVGGIGCQRDGGSMDNATLTVLDTPKSAIYDPNTNSTFILVSNPSFSKIKRIQNGTVTNFYALTVVQGSFSRLRLMPDGKIGTQDFTTGFIFYIDTSNKNTVSVPTQQSQAADFVKVGDAHFTIERFCAIAYGTNSVTREAKLLGVLFEGGWSTCSIIQGRIENGKTYLYVYSPGLFKVGKFRVDTTQSPYAYYDMQVVAYDPSGVWKGFVLVDDSFYFVKEGGVYKYDNTSNPVITPIACSKTSDVSVDGSFEDCVMQSPNSISMTPDGDFLVTDDVEHTVKLVSLSSRTVKKIAGGRGDGGLFKNAFFASPGLFMRNNGDLLLADRSNSVIRKVDVSTNIITTMFGTGRKKNSGDGGLATSASFINPSSIFEDSKGNFYITDYDAHIVRKVFTNGTITTVAGIANTPGFSGDGGNALQAKLKNPNDVAVNSLGEIFILDGGNNVVRKVLTDGTIITFAGNNSLSASAISFVQTPATRSYLLTPTKLTLKDDKTLFVVDQNKRVAIVKTLSTCPEGKTGNNCEEFQCNGNQNNDPNVCSSNGLCVDVNTCSCYSGWGGVNCEITMCYSIEVGKPNVCNGQGQCISNNTCKCNDGWEGSECKTPFCFGYSSTNASVCSGRGVCESKDKCTCLAGWELFDCSKPLCFSKSANDSNVCNGHGQCISNNTCKCNDGWMGDSCSIPTCSSIPQNDARVCSGRGSCVGVDICNCVDSWVGVNCEQFTCFGLLPNHTSVCNSRNGTCISNNTCSCENGWNGKQCEISSCFGIPSNDQTVCGGNGDCKKMNTCECKSGWSGSNCTIPNCFGLVSSDPLVCSSHGDCISNNSCQCKGSWFGNECQATYCYGEVSTSRSVCSSHGACIELNNCKCQEGWTGSNCSEPICFNLPSRDSGVCSSHGKCVSNDTCICEYGWNGPKCSVYSCFGILATDNTNSTCSGHGECQGVDTCKCDSKWKGEKCSLHTCFGILYNQTNVCSGNGSCVDVDKCSCSTGWSGNECSIHSCASIPANNPSTCSGHGSCSMMDNCICDEGYLGKSCELYYCFGKLVNISTICREKKACSPVTNCSNHGDCDIYGDCQCHSNSTYGFWNNTTCNECKANYYGSDCKTFFEAPVRFTNDFTGVSFKLFGSLTKDQTIECSRIITTKEMYLFGSKPTCSWTQASSTFSIKFSNDYQLTPNTLIHLNMLVFDSVNSGVETLIPTTVLSPLNPIVPTAKISQPRLEYGSCEEIIIDGSSSFSTDQKPLLFFWTISQGSSIVSDTVSNSSIVTLPSNAPHGDYSVNLKVKSSLSGLESQSYVVYFKKQQVSYPVLSIVGGSYISTIVTQVPAVVSTIITLPECISNSSNSLSYKWEKINGPELTMVSDSKDLIITEFKDKTIQSYTFKITITPLDNVELATSAFVYLNTTLEPFTSILYISELTTEKALIGAEFSTLDLSVETFKWTCQDSFSKGPCESSINTALDQYSLSKTTTISIPATKQNITIALQVRDVTSSVDVVFPTSKNVPPLINLLSITPSGITQLRSKDLLNLQLSISINGVEEGIDSKLKREWTLNSNMIPDTYVSNMKSILANSNYIILDISKLTQGSQYTLQLVATNLDCGLSSTYTFKFSVSPPVPSCIPSSSVQTGYALESKFLFSLPNCQLNSNLEAKFYFVDEKSGANIFLATGEQISTLLPLPVSSYLTINLIITDKTTAETSASSISVKVQTPIAKSIKEIRTKQKAWELQASKLLPGDPQTNVLNSGTIAQVVQAMMTSIGTARKLSTSCQNGNIDPITKECVCNDGYSKLDCSVTTSEWLERKELMDSLASMFSNAYDIRNKYEKITEAYLLSQVFSMRNILKSFDELSEKSIDRMQNILSELSITSNNNKALASPVGFEALLAEIANSLYTYRLLILKEELSSDNMNQLMNVILEMNNLMIRNKYIGGDSLDFKSDIIEITSNKIYPRDLSEFYISQSNASIKLPIGMMKYVENLYSKRKPLTLRLSNIINFKEPSIDEYEVTLLSNLMSFEMMELPLSNIIERIVFKLEMLPSARDVSSEVVCAMLEGDTWNTSSCLLSRSNTSNLVDCLCTKQGKVSVLSLSRKERIPETSSSIPSNTTTSSSRLELLAILSLLVLVFLVCACLIVCISCCIIRKKKQKATPTLKEKEMLSV